jgi:hypothetical protein
MGIRLGVSEDEINAPHVRPSPFPVSLARVKTHSRESASAKTCGFSCYIPLSGQLISTLVGDSRNKNPLFLHPPSGQLPEKTPAVITIFYFSGALES